MSKQQEIMEGTFTFVLDNKSYRSKFADLLTEKTFEWNSSIDFEGFEQKQITVTGIKVIAADIIQFHYPLQYQHLEKNKNNISFNVIDERDIDMKDHWGFQQQIVEQVDINDIDLILNKHSHLRYVIHPKMEVTIILCYRAVQKNED